MDLSTLSDAQLDDMLGQFAQAPWSAGPNNSAALLAEKRRRLAAASVADNVASDLEAASTPIEPDPVVGEKPDPRADFLARAIAAGYSPQDAQRVARLEATQPFAFDPRVNSDDSLRRGAATTNQSNAREAAFDASLAEAMGHNYDPASSSPLYAGGRAPSGEDERRQRAAHGFLGGDTMVSEGVVVPVRYVNARGVPMTTDGDVKRAKEAAAEAERVARMKQRTAEDLFNYGDPMIPDDSPELNASQRGNRLSRKHAEEAAMNSPTARLMRLQTLARRAGVTMEEAQQMGEDKLRMLAADNRTARQEASRQAVIRRAQTQNNPLEYMQNPTVNDWGQFVMASRLLGGPQGPTPLGVEAFNSQRSAEMAQRAVMGFLANNPGQLEAAQRMRAAERDARLRAAAGKAKADAWGGYERSDAEEALDREGATREERERILRDLFGPGSPAASTAAGPAAGGTVSPPAPVGAPPVDDPLPTTVW